MATQFHGYTAIGDSFTEGMNDQRADGSFRGWADLTAERLAGGNTELSYANLAIRGKLFDAVVNEQVPAALRMRPDLVSFNAGGNDALRPGFHPGRMAGRLNEAIRVLTASGARVVICNLPTVPPRLPGSRLLRRRMDAMNDIIQTVADKHGSLLIELSADEFADSRMWSNDRVHMSGLGHRTVAQHVCEALDVAPDPEWKEETPAAESGGWFARRRDDLSWTRTHFGPWLKRRVKGRSSGDDIDPKRPELTPIDPARP